MGLAPLERFAMKDLAYSHPASPESGNLLLVPLPLKRLFFLGCLLAPMFAGSLSLLAGGNSSQPTLLLVQGAGGETAYQKIFTEWASRWKAIAARAGAELIEVSTHPDGQTDAERLQQILEEQARPSNAELWIILIGHGSFDGREARFNLEGPDISPEQLAEWLRPAERPLVVLVCASASAPFLPALSAPGRIIITATKSGFEQSFSRFGGFLSEAFLGLEADLDKDGQVSLLEAFLSASHRVNQFYHNEGRLVTETALLDDNGDGLGTPADWFEAIRAVKTPAGGAQPDGLRAHQVHLLRSQEELAMPSGLRARRDDLELQLELLRRRKPSLEEEIYYEQLEKLLLELAHLYEQGALGSN
jgi:hypothetical protein